MTLRTQRKKFLNDNLHLHPTLSLGWANTEPYSPVKLKNSRTKLFSERQVARKASGHKTKQDSNLFQASVGGEGHNGVEPPAMLQDVQRQSHLRRLALPLEEPNVSLKVLTKSDFL